MVTSILNGFTYTATIPAAALQKKLSHRTINLIGRITEKGVMVYYFGNLSWNLSKIAAMFFTTIKNFIP